MSPAVRSREIINCQPFRTLRSRHHNNRAGYIWVCKLNLPLTAVIFCFPFQLVNFSSNEKKKRWLKKLTLYAYYFVKTSNNNNDNINNQVEVEVHFLFTLFAL